MAKTHVLSRLGATLALAFGLSMACAAAPAPQASERPTKSAGERSTKSAGEPVAKSAKASAGHKLDHSGRKRIGKASYYARKFAGRKMADGTPMKPHGNNAASKTLPLGTTAKVTNLETGQSATVAIRDRGPYVPGRIIDLSPATAEEIGITRKDGVAPVEVAPIAVPQPDGSVKPGVAAR